MSRPEKAEAAPGGGRGCVIQRNCQLLALLLTCLTFFFGGVLVYLWHRNLPKNTPAQFSLPAVKISFTQIELQAAPEVLTNEEPPVPEVLTEEELLPPEPETEISLQELPSEAENNSVQESVESNAQITQEAAAPEIATVPADALIMWVQGLIEKEKYYPAVMEREGRTGRFSLTVRISEEGRITATDITGGHGHSMLKNALNRMISQLPGKEFGQPLPTAKTLYFEFEFNLE